MAYNKTVTNQCLPMHYQYKTSEIKPSKKEIKLLILLKQRYKSQKEQMLRKKISNQEKKD